jgi:hypothetical protein
MTRTYRTGWISAGRLSASGVFASDQAEARTMSRMPAWTTAGMVWDNSRILDRRTPQLPSTRCDRLFAKEMGHVDRADLT